MSPKSRKSPAARTDEPRASESKESAPAEPRARRAARLLCGHLLVRTGERRRERRSDADTPSE